MYLDLTEEQEALRRQLRSYFAELMAAFGVRPKVEGHTRPPNAKEIFRKLGEDGWLGVGWPPEYGGRGLGPVEQLIFLEEADRAGVPLPHVTLSTVGPTLARFGTEEQKRRFLPAILRGEVEFAIGYTEPGAGTDLASLRTRAVRVGDEYVVNGQKVFTTHADKADYIWLAARTDPRAPKHKGISILIVDTRSPGFKVTPIHLVSGGYSCATYYEDVRVPADMLVGEENDGWRLMTTQLNYERVMLAGAGVIRRHLDEVAAWARETRTPGGGRVIDREWVRLNLARVRAKVEALELLNWRVASSQARGELQPADASALKVLATEFALEAARLLMEVLGAASTLRHGSSGAVLRGALEAWYRAEINNTFGGGTNEIQREIIATAGLGLPRGPR